MLALDFGEIGKFPFPKALLESGFTNNQQCDQARPDQTGPDQVLAFLHERLLPTGHCPVLSHCSYDEGLSPLPSLYFTEMANGVNVRLFPFCKIRG